MRYRINIGAHILAIRSYKVLTLRLYMDYQALSILKLLRRNTPHGLRARMIGRIGSTSSSICPWLIAAILDKFSDAPMSETNLRLY